ncbi:hypothetical protein VNI00_009070 [Paramarasmius palmivorus]|uniref:Uncharacterized protein n=1 Tax=Paramarasmius palmivorus TaxID=297713 RepID=A0AAW0CRG4_9AGAR
MGAAQSLLTPEAAVTAVVVVGAVGIGYKQATSTSDTGNNAEAQNKTTGKKKGKGTGSNEEGKGTQQKDKVPTSNVVPFPAVIPGQFGDEGAETSGVEASTSSLKSTKKGKGKKKKAATAAKVGIDTEPIESVVSPSAAASLAQVREDTQSPAQTSEPQSSGKKSKSKKKKNQAQSTTTSQKPTSPGTTTPTQSQELPAKPAPKTKIGPALDQSTISIDTDGEWTRVEARPKKTKATVLKADDSAPEAGARTVDSLSTGEDVGPATASVTTSTSDDEEEEPRRNDGQRRPLAERLLPKPRKTGVDDMLETSDYPTLSRVMRIQPQPGEKPAKGFSWADYEDVIDQATSKSGGYDGGGETGEGEDDDEGWGVVKGRGRPRPERSVTLQASQSSQKAVKAPETLTKKQRQNKAKREAEKSSKDDFNAQQERTLAQHRAKRIEEDYKQQSKKTSGGMTASVDSRGKLVWD